MAPKKTAKPEKDTQATNLQAEKLKALEHARADLLSAFFEDKAFMTLFYGHSAAKST